MVKKQCLADFDMILDMSSFSRIHKFCTSEGVLLSDERISLDEYLALDVQDEEEPAQAASKEAPATTLEKGAVAAGDVSTRTTRAAAESKVSAVPRLNLYYRSTSSADDAARSTTNPVAEVQPPNMSMSDNTGADDLDTPTGPARPESMIDKDASLAAASSGNSSAVTAGSLSETEWATVLRNCAVFYGWKIDAVSQRIIRAPRAAFQLRTSSLRDASASEPVLVSAKDPSSEQFDDLIDYDEHYNEDNDDIIDQSTDEVRVTSDARLAALHGFEMASKGIPNFRTNDDSRIEITACANAFAVSMAKSDFSTRSTEGSASGGFAGVTASASIGHASSQSTASKQGFESSTQTLVARYMYPRCDLFLRPEDLEPTPEFADLLYQVKTLKSLDALRKVQVEYGQ